MFDHTKKICISAAGISIEFFLVTATIIFSLWFLMEWIHPQNRKTNHLIQVFLEPICASGSSDSSQEG